MIFNEKLATQLLAQATEVCKAHPLPEGEDFFDALDDFLGPEPETLDYTPEQDEHYRNWLAKREARKAVKTAADHERETRAATMAFYLNEDNVLNECSLWEEV